MTRYPIDWIDILSDPAVRLAALIWKKDLPETWGILSRAIHNEDFSNHAPLSQFMDYLCLMAKADPPPYDILPALGFDYKQIFDYHIERLGFQASREELIEFFQRDYKTACERLSKRERTPPPLLNQQILLDATSMDNIVADRPSEMAGGGLPGIWLEQYKDYQDHSIERERKIRNLERRLKGVFDNIAWQPIVIFLCIASFIIGQFSTGSQPSPTPAPNITLTMLANKAHVQSTLTTRACLREPFTGTPSAPTCSDILSDEQKDNIIQALEIKETQSATQGIPTPCLIKGNISFDTGEKIYHIPGQKFYDSTIIDPAFGERWFCTEAEAQAAGWRKSRE